MPQIALHVIGPHPVDSYDLAVVLMARNSIVRPVERLAASCEPGPGERTVAIVAGVAPDPGDVSAIRPCDACAAWPELLRRAEARAHRTLTPAERDRFLG